MPGGRSWHGHWQFWCYQFYVAIFQDVVTYAMTVVLILFGGAVHILEDVLDSYYSKVPFFKIIF